MSLVPLFGLSSAASWGSGDYFGGLASRRAGVYPVTATSQVVGFILLIILAGAMGDPLPPGRALVWAPAAGLGGGLALIALWRSLAVAPMGIGAPVAAVVSAILPVAAGISADGVPSPITLAGFVLALAGIWLVSRARDARSREGFSLALLGGLGFGLYYVFIDRAIGAGVFWPLAAARASSACVVALMAARAGDLRLPAGPALGLTLVSGLLDVGGNLFFALAASAGRLDVAAVLASLYPAMTVGLARVALKERLAPHQAAGAAAILVAIPLIV